jgi:hypothetical protein
MAQTSQSIFEEWKTVILRIYSAIGLEDKG